MAGIRGRQTLLLLYLFAFPSSTPFFFTHHHKNNAIKINHQNTILSRNAPHLITTPPMRSFIIPSQTSNDVDMISSTEKQMSLSDLSSLTVYTPENEKIVLGSVLSNDPDKISILTCLSHFGDFNAWEMAQQYITALKRKDFDSDVDIILVGIGSPSSAKKFSMDLDLSPSITLVADTTGVVTNALNCYRGWLAVDKTHARRYPATDVNPYIKLLGMIFGFGSPGTIGRVLYGYLGDADGGTQSREWVVEALLTGSAKGRFPKITSEAFEGVPLDSSLRPFELATLRAQTGIHIVSNWKTLGPEDGDLFTRMGGTFVFRGDDCVYEYYDKGILTYAPMEEVRLAAAKN